MTTIYELEKASTPGPYRVDFSAASGNHIVVGKLGTREAAAGKSRLNEEAAELLVHCRNNFMKALEALKNCERRLYDAGFHMEADCYRHTIKELETV